MTDPQDIQDWLDASGSEYESGAIEHFEQIAEEWLQMHNALREIRMTWNLHFEPHQMHSALLEIDRICGSALDVDGKPAMALTPTEMEHHAERVIGRESELETMRMLARELWAAQHVLRRMGCEIGVMRPELTSWVEWAKGEYERD